MTSNSQAPIFILCCERSGSTLLRYILDTHPDICCPGELFLGELAYALGTTISRSSALVLAKDPQDLYRVTWQEVKKNLNGLMENFTHARGKKIWCDKTPANLLHLNEIETVFPDARYICLYRQGLDVVHSELEQRQKHNMKDWELALGQTHPEMVLGVLLDRWVQKTEKILHFEKNNPRTHRIRYEDLLNDPVKTLDPLFDFLGLTWDPALLDKAFTVAHDGGGGDDKIKATKGIEKKNIGKGSAIDPASLAKLPVELIQRQQALHLALGYGAK